MKAHLSAFLLLFSVFALQSYGVEGNLNGLLAVPVLEDAYIELKGSGYSVREFDGTEPLGRHGEWHFTTLLSVNPVDPKLYVSLEPMVHPRSGSSDFVNFNREVWFDGDLWIYSEQRLDDALKPIQRKSVVLDERPPSFLGNVDRDGDFFGLSFVPWRYGVFANYSLIQAFSQMDQLPFSIRRREVGEDLFSYEFKNICNETTLLFRDSEQSSLTMLSVIQLYNVCSDYPPSVTTTEFSNFIIVPGIGDIIAFPTEFAKSYEDHEGGLKSKRFGKLESVRLVSKDYVNQIFEKRENLHDKPLIDKTSGVIVLPNGEVRDIR